MFLLRIHEERPGSKEKILLGLSGTKKHLTSSSWVWFSQALSPASDWQTLFVLVSRF